MVNLNKIKDEFLLYKKDYGNSVKKLKEYNEFIEKYNVQFIQSMNIKDYSLGESSKDGFCYWIEYKLKGLGGIGGGTSKKWYLWKNRDGHYQTINGEIKSELELNNIYVHLKSDLLQIINGEKIKSEYLQKLPNLKILYLYHFDKFIGIFNEEILKIICKDFELDIDNSIDIFSMNSMIRDLFNDIINKDFKEMYLLSAFLWNKYKITEKDKFTEQVYNMTNLQEEIVDNSKNLLNKKKQIILYGPAGTGKTYNTKSIIVNHNSDESISDKTEVDKKYQELKDQGRIKFVTFHQSFAYEDFIEGIKPKTDDNGNVSYETQDGIFKELCNEAKKIIYKDETYTFNTDTPIWKVSLGGSGNNKIKEECYNKGYIRFSYEHEYDQDLSSYRYLNAPLNRLYNEMTVGDIVVSLDTWKSISQIGIIDGDYEFLDNVDDYKHARKIKWLLDKSKTMDFFDINNDTNFANAAIHKIYPNKDKFFNLIPNKKKELSNLENNYYLIIDEINRGNISKIFGELITLLEASKRLGQDDKLTTTLPYSKEEFGIPPNLYIIGTMNTSDKSIAHLDIALRRRFGFVEMLPDYDVISEDENNTCRKLLKELNRRIEILLDKDHLIGHSFFVGKSEDDIPQIMQYEIVPLLEEYFYGDYEKIQLVLGKNNLNYEEQKIGDYSKNIYKYWFEKEGKFDDNLNDKLSLN